MIATKFGAVLAALLALYPATAWADTFDLNCTSIDAQDRPVEGARTSRFHIDRDAARWCGGRCSPVDTITSDDGKVLVLGTPPIGAGLTSRITYDIPSRLFVVEVGMTGGVNRTRMLCDVEPFSGFTPDLASDARPQNLAALLAIRPPEDGEGRPLSGRVGIEVVVDRDGRISGCSATSSSGNAELDAYACRQAAERLSMTAATDSAGKPVEGRFRTTIAFAGG